MDEKLLSSMQPFWNSWYIDGVIGEGSYGSVYRIVREEFGQKYYSALKIISTPKNRSELKQALMEGMSESDAQEYFKSKAEEIYKEIIMMAKLKGKSSIVSYEDHQVVERKGGEIGYDILIRMELLKGLNDYVMSRKLEIPEIVRMGKEICQGLVICQNNGIMHRDIKPDNIFITQDNEFKLGDFGIARKMESLEHGLTIRGTYEYMAPEVYHGEEYDGRVDIYSLGIVLYMFLNKKKTPFLPTDTTKINHNMRQEALKQRFSGEQMETPMLAGEALSYVIMKAISFDPEYRYQTAKDFLSALESLKEEDMLVFKGDQQKKNENVLKRLKEEREAASEVLKEAEFFASDEELEGTVSVEENEDKDEFEEGTVLKENPEPEEIPESKDDSAPVVLSDDEVKPEDKDDLVSKEKSEENDIEKTDDEVIEENKFEVTAKFDRKDNLDSDDSKKAGFIYKDTIRPMTSTIYQPEKKKGNSALVITLISFVAIVAVVVMILLSNNSGSQDVQQIPDSDVVVTVTSPEPEDEKTQEPTEEPTTEPAKEPTKEPAASEEPTEEPVPEPITDFPDANSSEIEDITELENYRYAVSINVINNRIKDLAPLSECIYLEKLQASYNRISDITALEGLTDLSELDLIHNAIEDISPIAGLTKLRSLKLAYNNISDLTALGGLTELEELDLSGNSDIRDITPILGLTNLKNVYVLDIDGIKKKQLDKLRKLVEDNGGMLFE